MKILFVNNTPFNPLLGGIERVTDILSRELINRGHHIYHVCLSSDNSSYNYPVPVYVISENNESSLRDDEKLQVLINKENIDIVIHQRGMLPYMNHLLKVTGAKKISVLHSRPKAYIINALFNILVKSKGWKGHLKYIIKLLLYPLFLLRIYVKEIKIYSNHFKLVANHSDAIVVLSPKYEEELYSLNVGKGRKICVIPNPNTYPVQKIDWKKKEKTILYVGRLNPFDKNPIRLLQIWRKLHMNLPDWNLKIVGDGYAKHDLENYIAKHKLNRIFLEGSQKNPSRYYQNASIVCLTSNYEGWPMSLVEGMSYGCVPCSFNSYGAASDIIDDGINGLLISPYKINQYARKLAEIMNDDSKRLNMAKAAQKKVEQFRVEKIVDKWEQLFDCYKSELS